jgi:hypothetical protein
MWWLVGLFAVVAVGVVGVAGWLLLPTLRALRTHDFEPSSADEVSAMRAQQSGMVNGGDGGLGGL